MWRAYELSFASGYAEGVHTKHHLKDKQQEKGNENLHTAEKTHLAIWCMNSWLLGAICRPKNACSKILLFTVFQGSSLKGKKSKKSCTSHLFVWLWKNGRMTRHGFYYPSTEFFSGYITAHPRAPNLYKQELVQCPAFSHYSLSFLDRHLRTQINVESMIYAVSCWEQRWCSSYWTISALPGGGDRCCKAFPHNTGVSRPEAVCY